MGGLLKDEAAQMTMQAQTEAGAVRLLVCDYRQGELRGYADFDAARLADLGANPTLFSLFGRGYLAITFEPGTGQRYQGIVPLEGASLTQDCEIGGAHVCTPVTNAHLVFLHLLETTKTIT